MDTIIFGCSATNKTTSGNYNYYLMSRIDGYAVILREKTDSTEWLFRVILSDEVIATVWASATTETYLRPDAMASGVKKYVISKMYEFKNANRGVASSW